MYGSSAVVKLTVPMNMPFPLAVLKLEPGYPMTDPARTFA